MRSARGRSRYWGTARPGRQRTVSSRQPIAPRRDSRVHAPTPAIRRRQRRDLAPAADAPGGPGHRDRAGRAPEPAARREGRAHHPVPRRRERVRRALVPRRARRLRRCAALRTPRTAPPAPPTPGVVSPSCTWTLPTSPTPSTASSSSPGSPPAGPAGYKACSSTCCPGTPTRTCSTSWSASGSSTTCRCSSSATDPRWTPSAPRVRPRHWLGSRPAWTTCCSTVRRAPAAAWTSPPSPRSSSTPTTNPTSPRSVSRSPVVSTPTPLPGRCRHCCAGSPTSPGMPKEPCTHPHRTGIRPLDMDLAADYLRASAALFDTSA